MASDDYQTFEPTPRQEPRAHEFGRSLIRWGTLSGGFGTVEAGTLLAYTNGGTNDGKLRPFAFQVAGALAAVNEIPLPDVRCFRVGDSAIFLWPATVDPYLLHNADGSGKYVRFTARHKGVKLSIVDPAANSQALSVTMTPGANANEVTVVVSLATGGAGAITSTIAQVIAAIFASPAAAYLYAAAENSGAAETFDGLLAATVIPAHGATNPPLATSIRTVTEIDLDAETITVDGAAITLPAGIMIHGAFADAGESGIPFSFAGVALDAVRTYKIDPQSGASTALDAKAHYAHGGIFKPSKAIGLCDTPYASSLYRASERWILEGSIRPDTSIMFAAGE